jgi:hypothetical protein
VVKYPEPPTALPKLIAAGIAVGFVVSILHHFGVLAMFGAQ